VSFFPTATAIHRIKDEEMPRRLPIDQSEKVIGLVSGRWEFGPRELGGRFNHRCAHRPKCKGHEFEDQVPRKFSAFCADVQREKVSDYLKPGEKALHVLVATSQKPNVAN
jgi:predicted NodU family carbamoyl transferase